MLKKSLSILQYIFFLALGVGLLWYSFRNMSEEQMAQLKSSFRQTEYVYLLPVSITLMCAHFSRSLRWRLLMAPLGHQPSRMNVFFAVMIGYFFNLLVPRLGEVMKCTTLGRYEKISPDKLIGTIVAERAIDLICLILVVVLTIVVQVDVVGHYAGEMLSGLVKNESGTISYARITIFILAVIFLVMLFRWLFRRFGSKGFFFKMKHFFKGIWEGVTSFRYVQEKGWFILHTIFIWTMYLTSIYIGFYAFPQIEHLGVKGSLSVLTFGSLGMIIPTPGGVGSYQLFIQQTLELYDIDSVAAFAFGNVLWVAQTLILVIFGVLSLLLLPLFNRQRSLAKS